MIIFLLPSDLIVELSLYFNHRETIVLLELFPDLAQRCWLYKINKELNLSPEFIKEYVYNGEKKTLLPLDEKYLELKARSSVDFGTERYNVVNTYVHRASRHPNPEYARQLIMHITDQTQIDSVYHNIIEGLTSMVTRTKDFSPYLRLLKSIISDCIAKNKKRPEYLDGALIKGSYEGNPNPEASNILLTCLCDCDPGDYTCNTLRGLANGGHIDTFIKIYEINNYIPYKNFIRDAIIIHGRGEWLEYIRAKEEKHNLDIFVDTQLIYFNNHHLLNFFNLPEDLKNYINDCYIEWGYLEFVKNITHVNKATLRNAMQFNHVDMLNYIESQEPISYVLLDKENIGITIYHQTVPMFNFLSEHELFDFAALKNIDSEKLKKFNPKLYEHLITLQLIN